MKNKFYRKVLEHDISIVLFFLFLFCLGTVSLLSINITLMPPYTKPVLTIITDYHDMDPGIIEEIITRPIENVLKETEAVHSFTSFSSKGSSKIVVQLEPDADVDSQAVLIKDKIYHVSEGFPSEIKEPAVYKYSTEDRPVMILSLTPRKMDAVELYRLVEQSIKPELLSVEGVANVEVAGMSIEEYFIEQKYENLFRMGRNFEAVFERVVTNNASFPLGDIEDGNRLFSVNFPNKYEDLFGITEFPLSFDEKLTAGSDLFSVYKKNREKEKVSLINNLPALTVYIFNKDFSNILEIDKNTARILKKWEKLLVYDFLYNEAEGFGRLLTQLFFGLITSVVCVFCIVFMVYKHLPLSLLIISAVPLGFAGTLSCLRMFSKSLNLMSLAGFTVGMCMVIFNSVVVIDMLFSEALTGSVVKSTGGTRDRKDTIAYAVSKITRPLLAVTLTTIAVFLPILYMNKNTVSLYADFALSVSFMLLFSYLIAVFFIPACFTRFCPEILSGLRGRKPHGGFFDMIGGILTNIGFAGVKKVSKRSFLSLLMFTVISLIFFYFFITSEFEDISPLKEHQFELYYEFDPGYTHAYRTAAMLDIGREIMAMDLPLTLVSRLDESRASFFLHFPRKYSRLHDGIFMVYERLNTFRRKDGFFYFSADKRIGIRSFVVNLFGDDLETLHLTVDEVSQALSETHGVRQVLKGYRRGSPEIVLTVDPQNMYYHKLNAGEVIRMLRYVFYKPVIMKFYEGDHILDVRGVVGTSLYNKDDIMKLRVPNRNREFIALSDFASLTHEEGSGSITRMNGKRYVSIDVRYADVSADVLVGRVRSALKSVQQRDDFYYELDENLVTKRKSRALFLFSLALALFLEFLVLGTVFKSFKIPLIILITMPSLFIGGFLFLKISGFVRSVPAHLALIMLTGLSIKGVILMMEEVFRLKRMALEKKLLLVYRTKIRLLFLTTLTTLFSLLPVLFFATSSGFIRIVTGVISFGFMFSLLASLGIFPVLMGLILKSGSERIRR